VTVATRAELAASPHWQHAFAHERKDWRYYEIVEDTLGHHGFEFRYLLLADEAHEVVAVQPFFVLDQDLTAGAGRLVQSAVERARRLWPRLLKMRTLMAGCAAGEGHLDEGADLEWIGERLAEELPRLARTFGASLVVMKEFPSRYRPALASLPRRGFTRVPSLPMTRLGIGYESFDDYVTKKLSKVSRKNVRRKLRAADATQPSLELQVVDDVTPFVDEVYPLYLAVFERSSLHFEKLTKEFLCELGRRMPDKARFFIWRQGGKAVAFSLCMIHGDTIYDEYLGLDYDVALDLHLYFYTLRDILNWAIAHRLQWYMSSALNYDPKLHLRCELAPLDLYVRHTSPLINAVMKRVLPWLEPTRQDPVLRRFPNYHEVWG
jgi:predicted N-acyltransferase